MSKSTSSSLLINDLGEARSIAEFRPCLVGSFFPEYLAGTVVLPSPSDAWLVQHKTISILRNVSQNIG